MDEFLLPQEPGALWAPDSEHGGLRVEAFTDLSEADPAEVGDVAESALEGRPLAAVAVERGQLGGEGAGAALRPGPRLTGRRSTRSRRGGRRRAVQLVAACRRRRAAAAHSAACPPPARPPPDLAFVLCDQDPLCIVEQQNFDQLCSLVAAWGRVDSPKRRQLVDSLCSSLTCLNAWVDKLLAAPADAVDPASMRQHRSALKAYVFFLGWIAALAGREAAEAAADASQAPSQAAPGRGRRKKAAADTGALAGWDWAAQQPKVVRAAAAALSNDLWALFRPAGPDEALLLKATQLVWPGLWGWHAGALLPARCCCRACQPASAAAAAAAAGDAPERAPAAAPFPGTRPPPRWRTRARRAARSRPWARRRCWRWQRSSTTSSTQ